MRREDQRGGNGSVPGTRRKAVPIARASGPAEYTAGQQVVIWLNVRRNLSVDCLCVEH